METLNIRYTFRFPDQPLETFEVRLDPKTLEPVNALPDDLPEWTRLEFHQCSNCPLSPETHPRCPLAARLANLVSKFEGVLSYEELRVDVITEERTVVKVTTAQQAVSSLMGLIMATSGCPHTAFFKPMARFHLPLSSTEETVYQAASMYLIAQYLVKKTGREADLEMNGLREICEKIEVLNRHMAQRVRAAITSDAAVNAIVILDCFVKDVSFEIKDQLEHIQQFFKPYLVKCAVQSQLPEETSEPLKNQRLKDGPGDGGRTHDLF